MSRTITAMFDDRAHADAAVQQLMQELNVSRSAIQVHATDTASATTTATTEDTGFWASLKDLFVPDEDRTAYAEGVRRGGVVVSAQISDSVLDHASDIFENHGAVDLDSREASWRQEGWTGTDTVASDAVVASSPTATGLGVAATGTAAGAMATPAAGTASSATVPTGTTSAAMATAAGTARVGDEEVIPIVEENLRVGKRDVEHGRVRVRSYVVETPVTEQVTLREEHVDVQRRVVDRPVTDADALFQERTIEATESAEEAVIAKEARVTGEVVIRKEATERVQTVQDSVRRTEVEVDDAITDRTASDVGLTGSTTGTTTGSVPDGAPGNPPGTMASRAVDKALDTNISGANPNKR